MDENAHVHLHFASGAIKFQGSSLIIVDVAYNNLSGKISSSMGFFSTLFFSVELQQFLWRNSFFLTKLFYYQHWSWWESFLGEPSFMDRIRHLHNTPMVKSICWNHPSTMVQSIFRFLISWILHRTIFWGAFQTVQKIWLFWLIATTPLGTLVINPILKKN